MYVCMYVCMHACLFVCSCASIHRLWGASPRAPPVGSQGRVRWLCCASPSVIDGWGSILSTSRGVPARESFPSSVQPHPALSYTLHYIHTVSVSPPSHRTRARAGLISIFLHCIGSLPHLLRPGRAAIYTRAAGLRPQ